MNGMIKVLPFKTAEEVVARERERKERTTLLMALQEDHLAKFHKMADANEMWEVIKSRFGGNDESKKMQKYLLKQHVTPSNLRIHGAHVSHEDATQKFLRSLTSSWSQVALIIRTKPGLDTLSFNDLYNNLRVFERDVKGTTTSSSNTQNVAFVSADNTSSTNDINDDDMEEMDLKWQVAMISKRIKKAKGNQDIRRRDAGYNENKIRDNGRRHAYQDDSKALVTIDGEDIDWSEHVKEGAQNYAMIAYSSTNSGSDNETSADVSDSKPSEYASCESDSSVQTSTSVPELVENAPKVVCEPKVWNDAPIIEEYELDSDNDLVSIVQEHKEKPSFAFTDYVKHDDPHKALKDKGIVDSGCSRHMTGNKEHLANYQKFKGGSVTFGGSNGRITEAVNTACYVHNRVLVTKPQNKTPYELLTENQANKSACQKEANNSAGTQANDDQGANLEEIDLHEEHFILPICTPLSTAVPSRAFNDGELSCVVINFNNLETTMSVSLTPTIRIHTIHPKTQILRDSMSDVQTRSKVNKNFKAHAIVYRNKKNERGIVVRNKARLVAQGHRLEEGIDYDEVFTPVAKIVAIRIFLSFASYMGFIVYQRDVKSAFLYGTIDEEVYVLQPPGFVDPKFPNKVYKVVKALYGLHQAPRACVKTASTSIETQKPLVKDKEAADVDVTPKTSHLQAVKRIFRYLKGQQKLGNPQQEVVNFLAGDLSHGDAKSRLLWLLLLQRKNMLLLHTDIKENAQFHEIVDFLSRSSIFYALAISPDVCASFIEQFWKTATFKTINNISQINAKVAGKPVVITEASIRGDLLFNDMDGIECLTSGHTSNRAKGSLNLEALYALCTNLSNKVLALETVKDAQVKEILTLKARIKKLEKRCKLSISHHRAWLRSVSLLSKKNKLSKRKSVSKQRRKHAKSGPTKDDSDKLDAKLDEDIEYIDTEEALNEGRPDVSTARQELSIASPTTTTISDDEEMTLIDTLIKFKDDKAKGVALKDLESTYRPARSILTLKPLPTIDPKDKGKGVLEELELIVDERAKLLVEYFERRKKQLVKERAVAIRNKPLTRTQLRRLMMTYLKNIGRFTHSQLNKKSFEDIQSLYMKEKELIADFVPIRSEEDERMIRDMNKKAKEESNDKGVESIKKINEGSRMKRMSKRQKTDADLEEEEKLKTFLKTDSDDEGVIDYENQEKCSLNSWNFYENYGVHILILEDGTEIYMLAERRYPLTIITLEGMLSLRLIAESASDVAYDLLRFIQKQIDESGGHDRGEKDL
uniref:Copia protein n=1 Tax=Tanacetum cinerariifolium TaxID=118510 RepID=A0A6L2KZL0_TANCI|nr:copia protein [Tanacetum cinerariifolium]